MDLRYLAFCHPGSHFYDVPTSDGDDDGPRFAVDAPADWREHSNAEWTHPSPPGLQLPWQGWKVHVSATPDNADRVLEVAADFCISHALSFKFLRTPAILLRRNSKYGDRSSSGKFITIYPVGTGELELVLDGLGARLDGEPGPYILSDLRWRSGPLYVRYGGFITRFGPSPTGEMVPCIEDDEGNLVPDVRGPGFRPPPWVALPECLADAVAARQAGSLAGFPFKVLSALHFSNGGGVYRATDTRDGSDVLLKEARPYAGLDEAGRDAVERQRTERWALERLAGVAAVPELIDHRRGHEHYFLARRYVDGSSLLQTVSSKNPLVAGSTDPEELAGYTTWALRLLDDIDDELRRMHDRGVVYADLHPANVLIGEDDAVSFIDMETASAVEDDCPQVIGAPGFRAPAHYRGVAVDRYAMGCLRLAVFVPLTVLLGWDPRKLDELLHLVTSTFPLPDDFASVVRADLGPDAHRASTTAGARDVPIWREPTTVTWPALRDRIAEQIIRSATPEREDRLYPGDIGQFLLPAGGLSLAYGAAGVLAVLADLDVKIPEEHVRWLVEAARRQAPGSPGLFDGMAGVAHALDRLGEHASAREVLDGLRDADLDALDTSLLSGLAGLAAAYAHFARRFEDRELAVRCLNVIDRLRDQPTQVDADDRVGLMQGETGRAYAYLRAHEISGDAELLGAAADALRLDLHRLGWASGGRSDGAAIWRLPVLKSSSGGVALVADLLLRRHEAADLAEARDAVGVQLEHPHASLGGLFQGRAGMLLVASALGAPAEADHVRAHLRNLGLVAVAQEDGLAFVGDGLLRLSNDLATGSAGILAVVDQVVSGAVGCRPLYLFGDCQ